MIPRLHSERIIIGISVAVGSAIILAAGSAGWWWIQGVLDTGLTIPSGAVVAFDTSRGCPDGWSPFTDGRGRTIVGSGQGQEYPYRSTGGAEKVALTEPELPNHGHEVVGVDSEGKQAFSKWGRGVEGNDHVLKLDADDGPGSHKGTGKLHALPAGGGGKAHENRTPYIALFFCKKN